MANVSKEAPHFTYSQLHKVLTSLGFVHRKTDQFTVYREQEHDALIVLPNRDAYSDVGDPHLISVRNTVAGKGIVSRDEIEALLNCPDRPIDRSEAKISNRRLLAAKRRRPDTRVRTVSPLSK